MTLRKIKPDFIDDQTLDAYRDQFFNRLTNKNFAKRNLAADRSKIQQLSDYYKQNPLPFAKKQPKQKIGKKGMDELTKIVLEMKQDIKQIRDAQSFEGAQEWVAKHGPDLYTVSNDDVDNDGIPDVIVKNKDGNNVIVNGYTTGKSTWPYRYAYYTEYPNEKARKEARELGTTFRSFITDMYNPQYDEWGLKLQSENPFANQNGEAFEAKIKNAGYKKIIRPHNRTQYQAFVANIVKPIYDVVKYINEMLNVKTEPTLLSKVASDVWNQTILIPAMIYVYGTELENVTDSEWKKLRNRKEVKAAILDYVKYYITYKRAQVDLVPLFIVACNANGNIIDEQVEPWVSKILMARLLDEKPPNIDDAEAWEQIVANFNSRFPQAPPVANAVNEENVENS